MRDRDDVSDVRKYVLISCSVPKRPTIRTAAHLQGPRTVSEFCINRDRIFPPGHVTPGHLPPSKKLRTSAPWLRLKVKKVKGSPYSITERRVQELIPVLGSQPAGDVSHKPGGRLPLLSARPAVTLATRGLLPILLLGEQRHNGCEQFA